jgi:predicted GIY-YIG superfamily endonuclease
MTSDLTRRIGEHCKGIIGSPSTARHGVSEIIETIPVPTREEALSWSEERFCAISSKADVS